MRFAPALLLLSSAAMADPAPPPWEDVLRDAKGIFERHREDATLRKIVRAGEPRSSQRRTAVQLVPVAYQDVDCLYQSKKFGAVEKVRMTLHYEHGMAGWTMAGYAWGDVTTVQPGRYPPKPQPPGAQEVLDAVRGGLKEWRVRPNDVEQVTATGKAKFAWLDDAPTAGYLLAVRVNVRDVVDRNAAYGARFKTRFVCDLKVQLALEDGVTWTMQGTVPDCADEGCSLQKQCRDTWGGAPVARGGHADAAARKPPAREEPPPAVDDDPPPRPPHAPPPAKPATPPPKPAAPTAPPPLAKTGRPASGGCPAGQLSTVATSGHCCWREQVWSDRDRVCIGMPRCPNGYKPQGADCVPK